MRDPLTDTDAAFRFDDKMNFDFHRRARTRPALHVSLAEIETAQLVRPLAEPEPAYLFKHALVQDTAYESLMKHDRKRLHQIVAETLEQDWAGIRDENAALLARHFELAEDSARALAYLRRAAAWARGAAAHHEEVDLLARALDLAKDTESNDVLATLHSQRGKAFANLTQLREARAEFETALNYLPTDSPAARAQILNELTIVAQWLFDIESASRYAREALALAEEVGRDDLAAQAMSALAFNIVSGGDVQAGLKYYARAFDRAGEDPSHPLVQSMEVSGLAYYWIADYTEAAARIREAISRARAMSDSFTVMRGLGNLGMVLAGQGKYGQAIETFAQARAFGEKYDVAVFLARALSMEAGMYLELFDYSRAEETALEARAVARRTNFPATETNCAIDLMVNYIRRGDFYRADRYLREVEQVLPTAYGSHRWLWEMRFAYARAELALARMQWDSTLALANEAILQSRKYGRIKYEALSLVTLARAHTALRDHDTARATLNRALDRARANGNPAVFLHAAFPLSRYDRSKMLHDETVSAVRRIHDTLPDGSLRDRFDAVCSEWI